MTVDRADFTWQKASHRPHKGPVTTTYCHVDAVFATSLNSHVSPQIPKMAIRGSYEAALRKGVTTAPTAPTALLTFALILTNTLLN